MTPTAPLPNIDELLASWPDLSESDRLAAFAQLPRDQGDDFFLRLTSRQQCELLSHLPEGERRLWIRLLPPDDVADLIQLAPPEERTELLSNLDDASRHEVLALLAYQEDDAGGLMNPRFARLRPDMTADEAIAYLRMQATQGEVETIYYAFAVLRPT